MATFEAQIEGITQIAIESSDTVPTQEQVTNYLVDGIKDLINKIVRLKPIDSYKFSTDSTDSDGSGVTINGPIVSVVRENGSSSDIRPASQIPDQLRYLATDSTSLHYRSAYNPCYYLLNKKLYVLPTPSSSSTRALVSHISYPSTVFSDSSISDFPDEYEDLIMLYASAQSCQAAASDIQNNMPSVPIAPSPPVFNVDDAELPDLPVLTVPPDFVGNFRSLNTSIFKEDFDKADKQLERMGKDLDIYSKKIEIAQFEFQKEMEVFKTDSDKIIKDKDREFQVMAGEYGAEVSKFQHQISMYGAEIQSKLTKYKWYVEQHYGLMNQYNQGIGLAAPTPKKKESPKGE